MAFKDDLERLVKRYAKFNTLSKQYEMNPEYRADERFRTHLEGELIKLISQEFTSGSPDFKEITLRYKKLSRFFHPDKLIQSPESSWLENMLSDGQALEKGFCFKCLTLCYERLDPENRQEITFDQIKNMSDLKQWLQTQKEKSTTRTQANLYTCLLQMLEQIAVHSNDSQVINQNFLRTIMLQLPVFASGFCAFIFAEELLAVYGVCFLTLKLGQHLTGAEAVQWRQLGHKMEELSYSSALYTSSLLARVIEISFWLTNQSYHYALTVLTPMISAERPSPTTTAENEKNDSQALVLKKQLTYSGHDFKTPPLKMIAAPLDDYLETNAQQWFKPLRVGGEKRAQFKSAMSELIALDKIEELSCQEKLKSAEKILQELIVKPMVYHVGLEAPRAVDNAMNTLKWYQSELQNNGEEEQQGSEFCAI